MFVCRVEREWGGGLRVNMHHCSRLIFHQTARSTPRLPPRLDTTQSTTAGRGGGRVIQEISSSREGREEGRKEVWGSWEGEREFSERKEGVPTFYRRR